MDTRKQNQENLNSALLLAKEAYNLDPSLVDFRQRTRGGGFTARTIKRLSGRYAIQFSPTVPARISTAIHEVAHVVAFENPELKAEGHNTAYMDILYTLEGLL